MTTALTPSQYRAITIAMETAIGKVSQSVSKIVAMHSDDIVQDAWVKFLASYDQDRADATIAPDPTFNVNAYSVVRSDAGWTKVRSAVEGHTAFAYRVAYRVAIDYLRNRSGKLRPDKASLDATRNDVDGNESTIADHIPCQNPTALDMLIAGQRQTAVVKAIGTLPTSGIRAMEATLDDDRALTNAERIAKMRALESLQYVCHTGL